MNLGKKVEITIRDHMTGSYLAIPVIPERIQYGQGTAITDTVRILELGSVDFSNGVELDTLNWSSFFPARFDPSYVQGNGALMDPVTYRNRLTSWKDKGTALQIIIPAARINKTMYVERFTWEFRGFEGDLYYNVQFKEVKKVSPKQLSTAAVQVSIKKVEPKDRTPPPAKPRQKTYTVKRGDTLTKIAKANKISDWRRGLYEPNRPPLGNNPSLIYPGQTLKLPG